MRFLNYIPCKSISSRIPGKNLKLYGGKRLLDYTAEFAALTGNPTLLSSDLINLEKKYSEFFFHHRLGAAADTKLTNIEVINLILSESDLDFDYLVLLQPTHPVRCIDEYNEILRLVSDTAPILPVITVDRLQDDWALLSRSEYKALNGNLYFIPRRFFVGNKYIENFIGSYSKLDNIDIDTPEDEQKFEHYLRLVAK